MGYFINANFKLIEVSQAQIEGKRKKAGWDEIYL
jgi:hypothetical protein